MSSNHHTTDGPVFMNLGGRHRNMTIEPFEEEEPEFPQYGEFKRQIEQLINTKTHSNIFRPEPHNKEIGTSAEEQILKRRFLRINANSDPDDTQPPCSSEDTKNYHNMVRAQEKQALADTIACDLYVSVLGKHRRAQMQTLIDDTNTPARTRLARIKAAHWRQVADHVQVIIVNYKQQWYKGQVQSQDLQSAMHNLHILQEINRQVNNFDPQQTYTGIHMVTMILPTLVAREFNQMVRDWKRDIRNNNTPTLTEIADDIQSCFSIQNSVTNPDTYAFITKQKDTHYARANNAYVNDRHRDRNSSNTNEQRKTYSEADIRNIRDKAYREGKASNHSANQRERSNPRTEPDPQRQRHDNSRGREPQRNNDSRSNSRDTRTKQPETTIQPQTTSKDRDRSRSREQSMPRQNSYHRARHQTPMQKRQPSPKNDA